MEQAEWRILLLGENHTDTKARTIHWALRELGESDALVYLDEGVNALSGVRQGMHMPLEDEESRMLATMASIRSVIARRLPSEPDVWLEVHSVEAKDVYRWRFVLQSWSIMQHHMERAGIEQQYDELNRRMHELLSESLRFKVSQSIDIGSEQGEAFFALVYSLGRLRDALLDALADLIEKWVNHLRQNAVATLFLARVRLAQLLDEYDHTEWQWLSQMRNFDMARHIFMARQQHPQLRLVAKMGQLHLEGGGVAVQDYLRDIFGLACTVRMIDATVSSEELIAEVRGGRRVLKKPKYESCTHCASDRPRFIARHTGRLFCHQHCLEAAHGQEHL